MVDHIWGNIVDLFLTKVWDARFAVSIALLQCNNQKQMKNNKMHECDISSVLTIAFVVLCQHYGVNSVSWLKFGTTRITKRSVLPEFKSADPCHEGCALVGSRSLLWGLRAWWEQIIVMRAAGSMGVDRVCLRLIEAYQRMTISVLRNICSVTPVSKLCNVSTTAVAACNAGCFHAALRR